MSVELIHPWQQGARIRMKEDPSRTGVCTGEVKEARQRMIKVDFPGMGVQWKSEPSIELVPDEDDQDARLQKLRFGDHRFLRHAITRVYLEGNLSEVVHSMGTTATDFYAHQYKPVLAMLDSPSNALLIADEVGLGKTIEAGLVWTELRARHGFRRLVVVCPPSLKDKWCSELRQRFGVEAQKVDAATLLEFLKRPEQEWPDGIALVVGVQALMDSDQPNSARRRLHGFLEENPNRILLDLLILDEAHYVRNPETKAHKAMKALREHATHLLLLSATPINLRGTDLHTLLRLVDQDAFSDQTQFSEVLEANRPLVEARSHLGSRDCQIDRLLELLKEARSHWLLESNRQLKGLEQEILDPGLILDSPTRANLAQRFEQVNLLSGVVSRTRRRDVEELRVVRKARTLAVPMHPLEARLYSAITHATREFAYDRDVSDGFLLATPQRMLSSCMVAALQSWARYVPHELDPDDDSVEDTNPGSLLRHITGRLPASCTPDELERVDTKYQSLRAQLEELLDSSPGEKIIVFSYFTRTLDYLERRLRQDGIISIVVHGKVDEDRTQLLTRFRDDASVRILLASEVVAEGVDLQFCRIVVNYDLPWNPMKVEQRIGRVDRLGQRSRTVTVVNFCAADTIDERILNRLFHRLKIFEQALGGFEEILGQKVNELSLKLLGRELTPEEEADQIDQAALAIENRKRQEEELEQDASQLVAHRDTILERLIHDHRSERSLHDEDILVFAEERLRSMADGVVFQRDLSESRLVRIQLPPVIANAFRDYLVRNRLEGLTQLHRAIEILCRFENKVRGSAKGEARELVSQFHPLIRFLVHSDTSRDLEPVQVVASRLSVDSSYPLSGDLVLVGSLWTFEGMRKECELQCAGIHLGGGNLLDRDIANRIGMDLRARGVAWIGAQEQLARGLDLNGLAMECRLDLESRWQHDLSQRWAKNEDRADLLLRSLERSHERKSLRIEETLRNAKVDQNQGLLKIHTDRLEQQNRLFALEKERIQMGRALRQFSRELFIALVRIEVKP